MHNVEDNARILARFKLESMIRIINNIVETFKKELSLAKEFQQTLADCSFDSIIKEFEHRIEYEGKYLTHLNESMERFNNNK